ncbi:MAG TPA: hypothetical protein VI299_11470 [Polyangiales bacterium]
MSTRWNRTREDYLPDVRDGLPRLERVILYVLQQAERERNGRRVPSAELYGRVIEHINVSVPEFQAALRRLTGHG